MTTRTTPKIHRPVTAVTLWGELKCNSELRPKPVSSAETAGQAGAWRLASCEGSMKIKSPALRRGCELSFMGEPRKSNLGNQIRSEPVSDGTNQPRQPVPFREDPKFRVLVWQDSWCPC